MDVSTTQLNRTATHEGFAAKAYKDGASSGVQKYSIGYGHQIQVGEQNLYTATITRAQATDLLRKDFQTVVNTINGKVRKTLNQNQFDALADFGFNCGVGALDLVINELNTKGYDAVPAKMLLYTKWQPTPGVYAVNSTLVTRRNENVATWNSAVKYSSLIVVIIFVLLVGYYFYIENNEKIPFLT